MAKNCSMTEHTTKGEGFRDGVKTHFAGAAEKYPEPLKDKMRGHTGPAHKHIKPDHGDYNEGQQVK